MSNEQTEWLPLDAAIVWVAERDSLSFSRVLKKPIIELPNATDDDDDDDDDTDDQALRMSNAWTQLRDSIAKNDVRARGIAYKEKEIAIGGDREWERREMLRSLFVKLVPNPRFISNFPELEGEEEQEELEEEEVPVEPPISMISTEEVRSLVLGDSSEGLCLRPANWALEGGRGWIRVTVSRADLAKAFSAEAPSAVAHTVKARPKGTFLPQDRSYLSKAVKTVIVRDFPDGLPSPVNADVRNKLINAKVREVSCCRF